jgi:hypothetical protein
VLPEHARQLPAELARIDAFLDDERFIAPWRAVFAERLGRASGRRRSRSRRYCGCCISSTGTSSDTKRCAARWRTH